MTDPINFRALCVNLLDCLEKADWPPRYRNVFGQWASITRVALAEQVAEPPAVAEEEVAELVAFLRQESEELDYQFEHGPSMKMRRAAELLKRHAAPVPVPVSERPWEREDWCDEQGRCWFGRDESGNWSADWTLTTTEAVEDFCTYALQVVCLPAHALPLPAPQGGEVEP